MGKNKQLLEEGLAHEEYCKVGSASGALYGTILVQTEKFNQKDIPNIVEFCKRLYAEENIMIFPGKFFNSEEPFVRLTISCSNSIIEEFVLRWKRFCHRHLKKH